VPGIAFPPPLPSPSLLEDRSSFPPCFELSLLLADFLYVFLRRIPLCRHLSSAALDGLPSSSSLSSFTRRGLIVQRRKNLVDSPSTFSYDPIPPVLVPSLTCGVRVFPFRFVLSFFLTVPQAVVSSVRKHTHSGSLLHVSPTFLLKF